MLTGASLRLRLTSLRDQLEAGQGGGVERQAQLALELAEQVIEEYEAEISTAEAISDSHWSAEAESLKVLLMRDYATLWLEMRGAP